MAVYVHFCSCPSPCSSLCHLPALPTFLPSLGRLIGSFSGFLPKSSQPLQYHYVLPVICVASKIVSLSQIYFQSLVGHLHLEYQRNVHITKQMHLEVSPFSLPPVFACVCTEPFTSLLSPPCRPSCCHLGWFCQ